MSRRTEPRGFMVWIEPRPDTTFAEQGALARRREDDGAPRDLMIRGSPLCAVVFAEDRSLTARDQADLIDWLIDDPIVRAVAVSPLSSATDRPARRTEGYLKVQATDLTLIGVTLLYRNRALSGELYLQLLGGFVRPLTLH